MMNFTHNRETAFFHMMFFFGGDDWYDGYDISYLKSRRNLFIVPFHRTIKSAVTRRGCIRFRRFFHRLKAESEGFSVLPVSFVEEIAMGRYGP